MKPACLASLGSLVLAFTCPGQQMAWTQLKPVTSPWARSGHAMVYDSARRRTVLFGGSPRSGPLADTWEWDGKDWTHVKPTTSPPARQTHAMVFDSARRRTVLFGGWGSGRGSPFLADTWEWDGRVWTLVKTITSPSPRGQPGMAYDSARRRTVLFGGMDNSSFALPLADTWEWDGKVWTQIKPPTSPPARQEHSMAYDSARKRTVLFGGVTIGKALADTWEWDGRNWTKINSTTSPPASSGHAMVYDSARKRSVLFFGDGYRPLEGTWGWDGKNWTKITSGAWPPSRRYHAMAYDSVRKKTVLFGGRGFSNLADTSEWGKATLTTNTFSLSVSTGGTQLFSLDAGAEHARRYYWILGSVRRIPSGITLGGLHFPLNPDFYTDFTIAFANTAVLINTRGKLNGTGRGAAVLKVPKGLQLRFSTTLHHAYLVYDAQGLWHMVSNPVPLKLVK